MALRAPSNRKNASSRASAPEPVGARVLSAQEAWAVYDERARALLGISADEFEAQLAAGEFNERMEDPAVQRVSMVRSKRPVDLLK